MSENGFFIVHTMQSLMPSLVKFINEKSKSQSKMFFNLFKMFLFILMLMLNCFQTFSLFFISISISLSLFLTLPFTIFHSLCFSFHYASSSAQTLSLKRLLWCVLINTFICKSIHSHADISENRNIFIVNIIFNINYVNAKKTHAENPLLATEIMLCWKFCIICRHVDLDGYIRI